MSDTAVMERQWIRDEINPIVTAAQALMVVDSATFVLAMELGKKCSEKIAWIKGKLAKGKKSAYDSWQEWIGLENEGVNPLESAKKTLASRAYAWQRAEEERKNREAEEARKRAEEEAAKKRKAEEDARLELAERLEKEGMKEQAAEVLEQPVVVEVDYEVVEDKPAVKVQGASTRENWQFEITDAAQLPREYLTPDMVKIGRIVKAMKGETRIAGVRVFDAGTVSFRG